LVRRAEKRSVVKGAAGAETQDAIKFNANETYLARSDFSWLLRFPDSVAQGQSSEWWRRGVDEKADVAKTAKQKRKTKRQGRPVYDWILGDRAASLHSLERWLLMNSWNTHSVDDGDRREPLLEGDQPFDIKGSLRAGRSRSKQS
jgi:hypothetical protein